MTARPDPLQRAHLPRSVATTYAWDDQALQRTWRSFGTLGILLGLLNTGWATVPGLALAAVGAWAYAKGCPQCLHAVGLGRKR